jgi:uncharacterized protein YndB with AHSA1/START domain
LLHAVANHAIGALWSELAVKLRPDGPVRVGLEEGKLTMEVCPSEIIQAPVQRIWHLLADPRQLAQWSGAKLDEGPQRPVREGDRFILRKRGRRIRCQVLDAKPLQQLSLDVQLPLGIVNHELVQLTVLRTAACRVTFN